MAVPSARNSGLLRMSKWYGLEDSMVAVMTTADDISYPHSLQPVLALLTSPQRSYYPWHTSGYHAEHHNRSHITYSGGLNVTKIWSHTLTNTVHLGRCVDADEYNIRLTVTIHRHNTYLLYILLNISTEEQITTTRLLHHLQ